ncbi:hypothetical protein J3A69_006348 [Pseudomonas putida]|jgi:hypothetical protein|uniref:Uncharacterized protein n=1 Tax=Pseudomonas putida TaxID=303 RepID=A0A1L7NP18_PSEPU|nr:hypothetical protein [Pseudomonas sp. PvP089]MBP2092557.1 hypothetical protein [Pseudomonas sp. PvP088]MBP2226625.1 hypothetical protein [Pseudomonas putida]BAW27225.1 Uncharacterized protein KF715C_pB1190 [Pseudomonas putida]
MASFTPGREYHFTLSDGRNLVLRFVGLGQHMRPIWQDVATGTEIELPPYRSFRPV